MSDPRATCTCLFEGGNIHYCDHRENPQPTPHALTREQVEDLRGWFTDPSQRNLSAVARMFAMQLLTHTDAQRRTITKQAQEIERLQGEIAASLAVTKIYDGDEWNEIKTLKKHLAAMTAERDAAQQRYEKQCAGTHSKIEEIVHLRSDCKQLQALLTASEQEAGRLKERLAKYEIES